MVSYSVIFFTLKYIGTLYHIALYLHCIIEKSLGIPVAIYIKTKIQVQLKETYFFVPAIFVYLLDV